MMIVDWVHFESISIHKLVPISVFLSRVCDPIFLQILLLSVILYDWKPSSRKQHLRQLQATELTTSASTMMRSAVHRNWCGGGWPIKELTTVVDMLWKIHYVSVAWKVVRIFFPMAIELRGVLKLYVRLRISALIRIVESDDQKFIDFCTSSFSIFRMLIFWFEHLSVLSASKKSVAIFRISILLWYLSQ